MPKLLGAIKHAIGAGAVRVSRTFARPLAVYLSLTGSGLALVAAGVALIYPPAAFIVVGGVLFTLGLLIDLDRKPGGKP